MASRNIAVAGVEPDAASAFRSIMEILKGRTRCDWNLVASIEEADVVVVGLTGGRVLPDAYQQSGRQAIAIIDASDPRPDTPFVLTHPFRVMQVLSLLDDLTENVPQEPERHRTRLFRGGAWDFSQSYRKLLLDGSMGGYFSAVADDSSELLIDTVASRYACRSPLLTRIRNGSAQLSALKDSRLSQARPELVWRPLVELLWHNGYWASHKLAPWLNANTAFRISRWPDFGVIPARRERLQMVAALSARALSRNELVSRMDLASDEIDRVLNALSLSNLIAADAAATVNRTRSLLQMSAGSLIRSLIGGLRRHLSPSL